MTRQFLDCSISHITQEDAKRLDQEAELTTIPLTVHKYPEGYYVYPLEDVSQLDLTMFSQQFWNLLETVIKYEYAGIILDADGTVYGHYKQFTWE
jgi:hypothetical protein